MADPIQRPARRGRGFDLAVLVGGGFFAVAVLAAAYPALRAGPETAGGLMLILGLAGVAVLGLFAFRHAPPAEAASDLGLLLEALAEPAAVIAPDGRLLAVNAAWTAAGAPASRLPRPTGGSALFAALKTAAAGQIGRAAVDWNGRPWTLQAARLDARRLLLRLAEPASPLAAPASAPAPQTPA